MHKLLLLAVLLVAGCIEQRKEIAQMTPGERCKYMIGMMNDHNLTTVAQLAVMEKAKKDGCW